MPFDPNSEFKPLEPGEPKKPSTSDIHLPGDWAARVIEEHNSWIKNPYRDMFRRPTERNWNALHYEPGMVARTLVGGFGSKSFMVLDAQGNMLISIKPISEADYQAGVERQGGDTNV